MRNYIIFMLIFFFFSCNNKENKDLKLKTDKIKNVSKRQIDLISEIDNNKKTKNDTIVNDDFILKVMEDSLMLTNLKNNLKRTEFKTLKNKFDGTLYDTIIYYRNSKDSLLLFKTVDKSMILNFSIEGKDVLKIFNKIGINKNDYLNHFNLKSTSDKLFITDTEQGDLISLEFKNNKLIKIVYSITYLD